MQGSNFSTIEDDPVTLGSVTRTMTVITRF
jgi:hypothetical protein